MINRRVTAMTMKTTYVCTVSCKKKNQWSILYKMFETSVLQQCMLFFKKNWGVASMKTVL